MIDIAVVALVRAGRILLVHRRSDRENFPDCWDLPGGHVEDDEPPAVAARRECREELGIELPRLIPVGTHTRSDILARVFFAT